MITDVQTHWSQSACNLSEMETKLCEYEMRKIVRKLNLLFVGPELPCYITITYITHGKILISLHKGGRIWCHCQGNTNPQLSDKEVD